ncbi:hypothetical protein [Acanthopleuribacter pedis]|uniref:Aminoglycoside phosphotransferase domain-containing protein n=1 Tax=Acanthopleuribacter pedis TaxID=442870 RepID=A0A8J7QG56_9BACT|nr:hypothetical protein [Acanthopleuribacter pedis]MBO1317993.1 hypothetical protein [Acanthopleuribacter pedis]
MGAVRPKRVGFDLDNTIIDYRALFLALARREAWVHEACVAEKHAVKRGLRDLAGDADLAEQRWRQLQAWAYADALDQAYVFEGFAACVAALRAFHVELVIVSHKTEVSNYDPSARLHDAALRFFETRGFFRPTAEGGLGFSRAAVFFEPTREAKVRRIAEQNVDVFVDDLAEVFTCAGFPERVQPIWFRPPAADGTRAQPKPGEPPTFARWSAIQAWFELMLGAEPALPATLFWHALRAGGNNRLFSLGLETGERLALKTYPRLAASQERVHREETFARVLSEQGETAVAPPRCRGPFWLLSDWLPGRPVTEESEDAWAQMFAFLDRLGRMRRGLKTSDLPHAAHARFRLQDFVVQIQARFDAISIACATDAMLREVNDFVSSILATDLLQLIADFETFCQKHGLDPRQPLAPELWFPSPSDFGFHNALAHDGALRFLDFEYAGWDDLVKLLADTVHHLGFKTPHGERLRLVRRFAATQSEDPTLWTRFEAVHDLVGFEWILIVLNVALPEERARKLGAAAGTDDEIELISQRFARAKLLQSGFRRLQETSISV